MNLSVDLPLPPASADASASAFAVALESFPVRVRTRFSFIARLFTSFLRFAILRVIVRILRSFIFAVLVGLPKRRRPHLPLNLPFSPLLLPCATAAAFASAPANDSNFPFPFLSSLIPFPAGIINRILRMLRRLRSSSFSRGAALPSIGFTFCSAFIRPSVNYARNSVTCIRCA